MQIFKSTAKILGAQLKILGAQLGYDVGSNSISKEKVKSLTVPGLLF